MYRSFHARNFRCFADLQVDDIARINLIAGLNNVGKTALLEALFIHYGAQNPGITLVVDGLRGLSYGDEAGPPKVDTPWGSLFGGFTTGVPLELAAELDGGKRRLVRLRAADQPEELARFVKRFPGVFAERAAAAASPHVLAVDHEDDGLPAGKAYVSTGWFGMLSEGAHMLDCPRAVFIPALQPPASEDIDRYGEMELNGQELTVRDTLKVIEPRLRRFAVVVVGKTPMMHGDIGVGRLVPLPLMGGGMTRLFRLAVGIGSGAKGLVLVDEIENGLHHSVLEKVWRVVAEAARQFDVQVFATTHSFECIAAAQRAFEEELSLQDDFRLHRLERVNGNIVAKTYDREALQAAIEMGLEVR